MALSRALLLLPVVLAFALPAAAQERAIPLAAKRALLKYDREALVSLDGAPARLAPGATIRDPRNLIIVPAAIPRAGAWADYLLDRDGQVLRVWLLSADELARPRSAPRR